MNRKKKYIAVIVVSEQDSYSILRMKRFSTSNTVIRVGAKASHLVDVSKPTYSKGLKLYFFVDVTKGHLTFEKTKSPMNPKVVDLFIKQSIVKQLTARLSESRYFSRIFDIVIGLVIGLLGGFIIAGFVP